MAVAAQRLPIAQMVAQLGMRAPGLDVVRIQPATTPTASAQAPSQGDHPLAPPPVALRVGLWPILLEEADVATGRLSPRGLVLALPPPVHVATTVEPRLIEMGTARELRHFQLFTPLRPRPVKPFFQVTHFVTPLSSLSP